jgi:uncharacterized damage-inducible protein DinB
MRLADSFVAELEMEAAATRRVLDRVPEAHLAWKPHGKSSSLGQLALHVASLPQQLTGFVAGESLDLESVNTTQPVPTSRAEIMLTFDDSLKTARAYLASLEDVRAGETWRLVARGRELFAAPRAAVIRSFLFNHLYHHRGQLLVYLRLLDVPVPSVYGPTADENPFADAFSKEYRD